MSPKKLSQAEISSLTDSQKLPLTLAAQDADGNPADLAGAQPSFTVTPSTAGQVQADPADTTGTKFLFVPTAAAGNLGNANISASVVVGANTLTGAVDVNVTAGAAITLSLTPGTPQ
jgi:hypothetical protein